MQDAAGMRMRWRMCTPAGDEAGRLAGDLKVDPIVAGLLLHRGLSDPKVARQFLDPRLTHLHDPALLPGATDAANRILQSVRDGQPIVIYGDYDVDGITASSILWHMLSAIGAKVSTYVPHRVEEGYGLNNEAIAQIAAEGKPLIVSVDCGITAVEPAKVAREAGVDLIITDHHEFNPADLPAAHTLVHPRLPGGRYPFGQLCGAGVAFKLAWQLARLHSGSDRLPDVLRELLMNLISFAALGTIADVVPLVDENRVIASYGLGQIKRTKFAGLNAMIDASRLRDEKIDAYHVGFVLGPRLNACGRMGHARDAVKLLTSAEAGEAMKIAGFLTGENDRRRLTERAIFEEARQMVVDLGYDKPDCRAIVLGSADWHQGVIGIVASRLVDEFCRPVVMLRYDGEEAHGSARSVEGVSIHEALHHCAEHLTSYGGHAMAAGMRLAVSSVDAFRQRLVSYVNERLTPGDLQPVLDIDASCSLGELTIQMVDQLNRLAPFGRDNATPVLCVRRVKLAQPARRVGQNGAHLKFTVTHDGRFSNAIAFGMGDLAGDLRAGAELDIAFEPKINAWQGRRSAEMLVRDLRVLE